MKSVQDRLRIFVYNSEQCLRRPLRFPVTLFPILESSNTHPNNGSKTRLRQIQALADRLGVRISMNENPGGFLDALFDLSCLLNAVTKLLKI